MLKVFGRQTKKTGLESLSQEQLDRQRIRLEHEEQRKTKEIEQLEQQKETLFRDGTGAVSDRQRMALARKIKEVDGLIQARDKELCLLARNLHVIHSLSQLTENQRTVSTLGLEKVLKDVDLEAVKDYVDRLAAEQELTSNRFASLTQSLTSFDSLTGNGADDADTLAIVEAMHQAAHRGQGVAVSAELRQVTQQLRSKSEPERT
ncbi:MAG: hypothetical protein ACKV2Q_00635 [Planctomycetaceae bacterium]